MNFFHCRLSRTAAETWGDGDMRQLEVKRGNASADSSATQRALLKEAGERGAPSLLPFGIETF
jgi:hypothetical protein